MVKLIQDLSAFGPLLFTIILLLAVICAGWLIAALHGHENTNARRFSENNLWVFKRNAARIKGMRHS